MAESVARVKILAQIEGLEGFDKLKGAFRGLQQAIGPADADLAKARKEILAFGEAGAKSQQVIKGQVEALKALQSQATIGSAVYKQLGKDVRALGGAYQEAAAGAKQFSDAQLKSQKPGAKTSTFAPQVAALKKDLQELSVYSQQYSDLLTKIQRRELPFNLALGRQGVIAAAEAYRQGPELANAATRMPELPDTTAGLNQRMAELAQELVNVKRGGEAWIRVSREMAQVQRQLNQEFANPAVEAARRRLEQSRNVTSGFLGFSSGLEDRIAVQRSIERNQRKREREAAAISGPMQGPPAPSDLFRNIAGISNQTAANQVQLMGRSYREVADSIRQTSAASDGSVNSLRSQRAAWEALRNSLGDNKAALKEVNRELAAIDGQLERRTGGGNALGQRFQTVGAIASGAVFGGPAGFIGGAAGAAYGASAAGRAAGLTSFGGALGGAAAGAAVGGIAAAAAGASNYAAEIARLQIALKGVSTNQAEFNNSLKFIRQSAPQFLTSLGDATKNYTRLQASVRGAGMGVEDTQTVFKGLSAAIVATGGGTEQMNAAMLAASQVFSKGKVSAEELRGQIGERLPGAFTIFAEAVKMTPQQLDKALQDGKVTTQQFVQFSRELFKRYGDAAKSIGDSPFAASIRFQLAMDNFKLAAGQALLPTISFFQNLGTEGLNALTRIAEGTTGWQRAIAEAFNWLGKLIGGVEGLNQILGGLIKTMIVLGGVQAGLFVVSNLTAFSNAFKGIITATRTLLELSKSLLKVETARAAINAILAGLTTGATKGKIAGAVLGLTAGGVAAIGLSKFVDSVVENITGSIEKATKMPELGGNFGGQQQRQPPGAAGADPDAEKRANEAQRLAEQTAEAQRRLDDRIFQHQIELDRKRFEIQQQLADLRAQTEIEALTGVSKEYTSKANELRIQLRDLFREGREAAIGEAMASRTLAGAQSVQVVAGGATTGIVARTGNTGQSTGAHLDLRWGDGRPISRADADKYFLVNGRAPSSFGVTSPYGPRSLFGRHFHHGIDFGTPAGSAISLRGGATLSRNLGNTGAGGYAIEVMTPEGTMRALHLMANSVAGGNRSQVRANALVGTEQADLQQAAAMRGLVQDSINPRAQLLVTQYVQQNTAAIRERIEAIGDENVINRERFRLQMEGMRPELVNMELELLKTRVQQSKELAAAQAYLAQKEAELAKANDPKKQQELRFEIDAQKQVIAQLPLVYDQLRASIEGATRAQIGFGESMRFRQDTNIGAGIREGAQQYVESIGTMRQATAQLAQTGIKGVEDAIFSLVTTGKANFQEFAASILRDTARMIIQQLILRTIMQAIGAIGGGASGGFKGGYFDPATGLGAAGPNFGFAKGGAFAKNGIIPFAMGGIVDKPTLFKFANGGAGRLGLMGEAGPEAIIPLRRGRDGKLGVAASGGAGVNVTVNVDAGNSQVQGDGPNANQLGRVIGAAVQAEIVKQQRPGGLLATTR